MVTTIDDVLQTLGTVPDPEIPTISIVDLGMVFDISLDPPTIKLLPTFTGCPAKNVIEEDVRKALPGFDVRYVFDIAWTPERVSDRGRAALKEFGISPDPSVCPYCSSTDVRRTSDFGPTPCRSVEFCNACRNPFEGFKPK